MTTTITSQNWTAYTGFTSAPTVRYFMYDIDGFLCKVSFQYEGYAVNLLGGVHTFTLPLPVTVPEGQAIIGGSVLLNFNPTLTVLISNSVIIPATALSSNSHIVITIQALLNNPSGNKMNGSFIYSLDSPFSSNLSEKEHEVS